MIEKSKEEQAAEARVSKMLAEALAEDLGDIPKVSITVEELKALERADRKRRRKRKLRYFGLAAAAVFVCVVALYALWPETAVPVSADKNTEQRVEEKDGMVVINEGDVEGGGQITEIYETNWKKIESVRRLIPKLVVPRHIPKEYAFRELAVERYENNGFLAQYIYSKDEQELCIEQREYEGSGINMGTIDGNPTKLDMHKGTVYLYTEKGNMMGVLYTKTGILKVVGCSDKVELVKIIENIDLP